MEFGRVLNLGCKEREGEQIQGAGVCRESHGLGLLRTVKVQGYRNS